MSIIETACWISQLQDTTVEATEILGIGQTCVLNVLLASS